jgi:NAD(P)-dependent dehydrogenase (short-subunit alcohol dehydrogenase family)
MSERVAIVAGAGGELGLATAEKLAAAGQRRRSRLRARIITGTR